MRASLFNLFPRQKIDGALERLKLHGPRRCESSPDHGQVSPTLESLELSVLEPDAALYTCANERCGWRRFDKLKTHAEVGVDVTAKFTVNGRDE
jgi:hypothetical protein